MQQGFQSQGQSYWEHGSRVATYFHDLLNSKQHLDWKLPTWFVSNNAFICGQLSTRHAQITTYLQWHDLGKPYCRTIDEGGRVHYPNHALVSATIWESLGGDGAVGQLIADDMLCHQLKPSDAALFSTHPNALVLLVSALCELHANAPMFGGFDSDSFKIKYKRLEKCGKTILNHLTKE